MYCVELRGKQERWTSKGKIKKEVVNFMTSNDTMVRLSNQTDIA